MSLVIEGVKIDETTIGMWYLPTTEEQDWLCVVRELVPDEEYELVYRFRYYTDKEQDDPFESSDKKNWYRATAKQSKAYTVAAIRSMARLLSIAARSPNPFELLNDGDLDKFRVALQDAPFAFVKIARRPE